MSKDSIGSTWEKKNNNIFNLFSNAGEEAAFFIKFPRSIWRYPQLGEITRQTLCSEPQELFCCLPKNNLVIMNSKCGSDAQLRKIGVASQSLAELRWFTPAKDQGSSLHLRISTEDS